MQHYEYSFGLIAPTATESATVPTTFKNLSRKRKNKNKLLKRCPSLIACSAAGNTGGRCTSELLKSTNFYLKTCFHLKPELPNVAFTISNNIK